MKTLELILLESYKNLQQRRQFVDVDDSRVTEVFQEAIEHHPYVDDPRAEVSLLKTEQDDTSLADRFPPRWTSLHCGPSSWW